MRRVFCSFLVAFLLSACSSAEEKEPAAASESSSFGDKLTAALFGAPATGPAPGTRFSGSDLILCPEIMVRHGTAVYPIVSGNNLRFQASIGQTARECALEDKTFYMKVGVEGRLVTGPAGAGGGKVDLPIRIAIVQEGSEQKTIWTKIYRVPASVAPGAPNATFLHVEPNISFALPPPSVLDRYVVYVGFDTMGGRAR